jgi:hypothetical protein
MWISKKKWAYLLFGFFTSLSLILVLSDFGNSILFFFGYVWNWSLSHDLTFMTQNQRYRFSMFKFVYLFQNLFLKLDRWIKNPYLIIMIKSIPAGVFWLLVSYFNESQISWWLVFVGSMFFEVTYHIYELTEEKI